MFFETITHELARFALVFSDDSGAKRRAPGERVDVSDRSCPPLFSLRKAKDLILY